MSGQRRRVRLEIVTFGTFCNDAIERCSYLRRSIEGEYTCTLFRTKRDQPRKLRTYETFVVLGDGHTGRRERAARGVGCIGDTLDAAGDIAPTRVALAQVAELRRQLAFEKDRYERLLESNREEQERRDALAGVR